MDILLLKQFFMWCSIINGSLLIFSSLIVLAMPNFIYKIHRQWFGISRDTFNTVIYAFLGLFKIVFYVFNLIPFIALVIIQ